MAGARQDNRTLQTVLGAAVATLLLVYWYVIQGGVDISPMAPVAPGTGNVHGQHGEAPEPTTPLDKERVALFQDTVNRPLFTPDRKPVQRDRSQPGAPAAAADIRLVGVMKLDRQPARALIRVGGEASGKWVAEGEQFGGWKLRQVLERSVIVEAN